MKKVMILGAGIYQVPLIKKVKELGYQALVVTPMGNYPGIQLADILIESDTRNKESILSHAISYKIDAILTTGTDVAVPTIGFINESLGLNGISFKAAVKSMNKIEMKKSFVENNIPTARFAVARSYEELETLADDIGYPLMVKAVDSSGSRGICKVTKKQYLNKAYQSALQVTASDEVLIEEFLDGIEIGAQAIVVDGEVVDVFLHDDDVTYPPICVPIGHAMPLCLPEDVLGNTKSVAQKAVRALGINNTISNIDILLIDNKPFIIEIAGRMGATCLAENISIYAGFDVYEFIISLALGGKPKLPHKHNKTANAALLIRAKKAGIVKSITIPRETKEHINLMDLTLDIEIGSMVNEFKVGPDRIGHIIVKGETTKAAKELAENLHSSIDIQVQD